MKTSCKLYLFDNESRAWKSLGSVNLHINQYESKDELSSTNVKTPSSKLASVVNENATIVFMFYFLS